MEYNPLSTTTTNLASLSAAAASLPSSKLPASRAITPLTDAQHKEELQVLLSRRSNSNNQVRRIVTKLFDCVANCSLELNTELKDIFMENFCSSFTDLHARFCLFHSVDFIIRSTGRSGATEFESTFYRNHFVKDLRRLIELLVDCERKSGEIWRLPRPEANTNIERVIKYVTNWRLKAVLPETTLAPIEKFLETWSTDPASMVRLSGDAILKRMEDDRDAWKRSREHTWLVTSPIPSLLQHLPQTTPQESPIYSPTHPTSSSTHAPSTALIPLKQAHVSDSDEWLMIQFKASWSSMRDKRARPPSPRMTADDDEASGQTIGRPYSQGTSLIKHRIYHKMQSMYDAFMFEHLIAHWEADEGMSPRHRSSSGPPSLPSRRHWSKFCRTDPY